MGIEGPITVRQDYSRKRVSASVPNLDPAPVLKLLTPEVAATLEKVLAKWPKNSSEQDLLLKLAASEGFRNLEPKFQSISLFYLGGQNKSISAVARAKLREAMKKDDFSHQEIGVQETLLRELLTEQRTLDWTVGMPKTLPLQRTDYKILRVRSIQHEFDRGKEAALVYEVQFGTQKIDVVVPEKPPELKGGLNKLNADKPHTLGEILEGLAHTPGEFRSVITKVIQERHVDSTEYEKKAYMNVGRNGVVRVFSPQRSHSNLQKIVSAFMHEAGHILTMRAWGNDVSDPLSDWIKYDSSKKQSFNLTVSKYPRDKGASNVFEDSAELMVHNFVERKTGNEEEVGSIFPGRAEMIAGLQAPTWNKPHSARDQLIRQYSLESLSGKQIEDCVSFLKKGDNALKYGPALSSVITDKTFSDLKRPSQDLVLNLLKRTPDLSPSQEISIVRLISSSGFKISSHEVQQLLLTTFSGSSLILSSMLESENFQKLSIKSQKCLIELANKNPKHSDVIARLGESKSFGVLPEKLQNKVLSTLISSGEISFALRIGLDSSDFKVVLPKFHEEVVNILTKRKDLSYGAVASIVKVYSNHNFARLSEIARRKSVDVLEKFSSGYFLPDMFTSNNFRSFSRETQNLIFDKLLSQTLQSDQNFTSASLVADSELGKFSSKVQKGILALLLSNPDNYDLRPLGAKSGLVRFPEKLQIRFLEEVTRNLGNKAVVKNLFAMASGPLFPTLPVKLQDQLFANPLTGKDAFSVSSLFSNPKIIALNPKIRAQLIESALELSNDDLRRLSYTLDYSNFKSLGLPAQMSFLTEYSAKPSFEFGSVLSLEGFTALSSKVQIEVFKLVGKLSDEKARNGGGVYGKLAGLFRDGKFLKLTEQEQIADLKTL